MEDTYIPTDQERQEGHDYYEASMSMPTMAEKKELVFKSVKDQIMSGYLNPLEFYRQAKIVIDTVEALKKDPDIFDCAFTERAKYGKEKPVVNGSTVDTSQRTTYDYASCEDSVYEELKEKLKAREKFLQSLPAAGTVDPETGAFIKAPVQKISTFITVKI
jgi:predicted DNA-binding protein YlxM (UPF0122 family)